MQYLDGWLCLLSGSLQYLHCSSAPPSYFCAEHAFLSCMTRRDVLHPPDSPATTARQAPAVRKLAPPLAVNG